MLYVNPDGTIRLTRGDTARLVVPITNLSSNTSYTMDENDELTLTIKKNAKDTTALVQKIVTGSNNIHISPTDTSSMAFGKYKYDVQLTTSSGDVYTVIEPKTFEIMEEITH